MKTIPVIDVTDLYHPHQDPGDNFDLLTAYALPEIDLRAVLLDITQEFRQEKFLHPRFGEQAGPREPGVIPVTQCNYLFGRSVPYGIGPFRRMRTPKDTLEDCPPFMNAIDCLLRTLAEAVEPVHILSFGSARIITAAYNRAPELLMEKTACIHLAAGASGPYLEWNVELDIQAFVGLLRSPLPIALYPCATTDGPFDIGVHNTFWRLYDLSFIRAMDPPLRRYLLYAFGRSDRSDFLRCLEQDVLPENILTAIQYHNVWETAVWMQVAGRVLTRTPAGVRYCPRSQAAAHDVVLKEELIPCTFTVEDSGLFTFSFTDKPTNKKIYRRETPPALEAMLAEALTALYLSYRSTLL